MRYGIHLDALERLLMLPKDDIDNMLNTYLPQLHKDEETWLCPKCMNLNIPSQTSQLGCSGNLGKPCPGEMVAKEDDELPTGWMNWLEDPTMHLLVLINQKWLDARR